MLRQLGFLLGREFHGAVQNVVGALADAARQFQIDVAQQNSSLGWRQEAQTPQNSDMFLAKGAALAQRSRRCHYMRKTGTSRPLFGDFIPLPGT